jgi:hypothetical protein
MPLLSPPRQSVVICLRPDPTASSPGVGADAAIVAKAENGARNWLGSSVSLTSPWDAKLDSMSNLKKGWNGYGADPPSLLGIEMARRFVRNLEANGLSPTRVAPSVVGGVGVTRRVGNKRAYFEFYNDGTAHVMLAEGAEAQTFPLLRLIDALLAVRAYLNG